MTTEQVDAEIQRAFQVWSRDADVEFHRTNDTGDIEIWFVTGEHGDDKPFLASEEKLAHAFYPEFGGDIHMNDARNFTAVSEEGINLLYAVAHEIGHSLGLKHSSEDESLMTPYYKGYVPNLRLHQDDINGINSIYPPRTTTEPTSLSSITPKPRPAAAPEDPCDLHKVDAVVNLKSANIIYIFSGEYFWRLDWFSLAKGYPRRITDQWRLPNHIDAALDFPGNSSVIYFFKGDQYWKYSDSNPTMTGYPRTIGQGGFYGIPANVDSAFLFEHNGRIFIYFTQGNNYYRLGSRYSGNPDDVESLRSSRNYPKPLSHWPGLVADSVDAAVQLSNGATYFFKEKHYFRFNSQKIEVDEGYPKPTLVYWIGCKGNQMSSLRERASRGEYPV